MNDNSDVSGRFDCSAWSAIASMVGWAAVLAYGGLTFDSGRLPHVSP